MFEDRLDARESELAILRARVVTEVGGDLAAALGQRLRIAIGRDLAEQARLAIQCRDQRNPDQDEHQERDRRGWLQDTLAAGTSGG